MIAVFVIAYITVVIVVFRLFKLRPTATCPQPFRSDHAERWPFNHSIWSGDIGGGGITENDKSMQSNVSVHRVAVRKRSIRNAHESATSV